MEFSSYLYNVNVEGNMTSYYLLRKNQESGPYTLRELKAMPLYSTDLIWINGESTCWNHPSEIEGLRTLPLEPELPAPPPPKSYGVSTLEKRSETASSSSGAVLSDESLELSDEVEMDEEAKPSFEELKRKYAKKRRKKVWKSPANIGANLFGLTTLVLGLMAAAFMIKKAVDNIEHDPIVATAEATLIQSEQLPVSTTSHAAMATAGVPAVGDPVMPDAELTAEKQDETTTQKTKNSSPVLTTAGVDAKSSNLAGDQTAEKPEGTETEKQQESVAIKTQEEKKEYEEAEEKKAAKPSLQVDANSYKVNFLGGISNLELSVSNPSSQSVNRAVVEVEYLKANGKVVGSQTVEITGIAPGSSKKVAVPDHSRGVSVRYRVVNVES